jgi:hypothetical protein
MCLVFKFLRAHAKGSEHTGKLAKVVLFVSFLFVVLCLQLGEVPADTALL